MEHSIIVLVALVLLIVFAGFQFQKVLDLFRTEVKTEMPMAVKTIVRADKVTAPKVKKAGASKGKSATKKAPTKKTSVKKVSKKSVK